MKVSNNEIVNFPLMSYLEKKAQQEETEVNQIVLGVREEIDEFWGIDEVPKMPKNVRISKEDREEVTKIIDSNPWCPASKSRISAVIARLVSEGMTCCPGLAVPAH